MGVLWVDHSQEQRPRRRNTTGWTAWKDLGPRGARGRGGAEARGAGAVGA